MPKPLLHYRRLIVVALLVALSPVCEAIHAQTTSAGSPALQKSFAAYLAIHKDTPEDYVVGKFRDKDIVFLGEQHHIEQNLEFAQRLIPKLYASGIYNMGFEFILSEDQPVLDRLLGQSTWDQATSEDLLWRCANLPWVSTGYVAILHAAWRWNHGLKSGQRRFRIVGLNLQFRPTSRSQLLPGEVSTDHRARSRLLGLNDFDAVNIHWAEVISREFIAKREKALIYCGSGHSWTRFFYQRVNENGITVGNLIYNYIGERTLRLVFHGDLQGGEGFEQIVESLMEADGSRRQVAFDVCGGPLADVPVRIKGYLYGSDTGHQLTAGDVWDGYLYLGPRREWRNDSFITTFITEQNFSQLQRSWELFSPKEKVTSPKDLIRFVRRRTEWLSVQTPQR